MKDFFKLLLLNLAVKKRNFVEFLKVMFFYYRNTSFAKTDLYLLSFYVFQNPFKISKRFLTKIGEKDIYAYGETPLTTFDIIIKECDITSDDIVFELGSGRGRDCFWLHFFHGCQVIGIEFIPEFLDCCNRVKNKFQIPQMEFRCEDMLKSDFTGGTVFYLYGTCYETEFIKKLIEKFKKLPRGTKIITVSYSLNDYTNEPIFDIIKKFPATFTWGEADIYLNVIR